MARVSAGNGGASHLLHQRQYVLDTVSRTCLRAVPANHSRISTPPARSANSFVRPAFLSPTSQSWDWAAAVSPAMPCQEPDGHYFQIDPLIERIARDPGLFTFLQNTNGQVAVEIGDGRKKLEEAAPGSFDLIVIDAFSSDSVPVHLMTREAVDLYASRLRPGGIIALHISNRYVQLEPVIAAIVAPTDLFALTKFDSDLPAADAARGRLPSHWVLLTAEADRLAPLGQKPGWRVSGAGPPSAHGPMTTRIC